MAQKHLHELLKEDQEPFHLKKYIADRRCQLKRSVAEKKQQHLLQQPLQIKKLRKPLSNTTTNNKFSHNFCKNACFYSFVNSPPPDPRKSPLFPNFHSPAKSPISTPNTLLLHVPARTAALLLEAALRIQKQSSSPKAKAKNFGLLGSLLKRMKNRTNKSKKQESGDAGLIKRLSNQLVEGGGSDLGSMSCSCNERPSSAVWSEGNGDDKSLDLDLMETSSSSGHSDVEEEELAARDFASFDQHFCESPFHFVLRRSPVPSSGHRTPDFLLSPAASPGRHHKHQLQNKESDKEVEEEEEDKEQCSPVSVLDPPFEDDDDGHDDPNEDDGFDQRECSYAIVQKQLLAKLRRFEKLAELDPIELEKRILEQEQESESDGYNVNDSEEDPDLEEDMNELIIKQLSKPYSAPRKIPNDMKRLVSDLIHEEEQQQNCNKDRETVSKRVCKRLESWKEVECNTIDMMVEQDFRKELNGWKMNQEQVGETAVEIELAIFGLLVEELSEELNDLIDGI